MLDIKYIESQKPWPQEAEYGNTLLFFSGTFDKNRAQGVKLVKLLDVAITAVLLAISLGGIAAFAFQAYRGWQTNQPLFFLDKNFYNLVFAFSLYPDLYLWSAHRRDKSLKKGTNLMALQEPARTRQSMDVFTLFSRKAQAVWNLISENALSLSSTNSALLICDLFKDSAVQLALARLSAPMELVILDLKNIAGGISVEQEREIITRLPFESLTTALDLRAHSISSLIILYALVKTLPKTSPVLKVFSKYGLDERLLEALCGWQISLDILNAEIEEVYKYAKYKTLDTNRGLTSIPTPYLDQFSVDLTAQAKYGHLPLAYGREGDLEEIFKLFSEKIRFIAIKGAEGTGRSALINELAYRMVPEEVPEILQDKRLVKLEISSILGSNVSPEAVLSGALNEAEHNDNIILVIEDIHLLGKAQGAHGLNLLQVLVNHFQESNLMVLATTTSNDYLDYVRPVGNFDQLFNIYELLPLSPSGIIQALCVKAAVLENKNKLFFSYEAIATAAKLSSEFFSQQGQPQAAINLLTEVATKAKNGVKEFITKEDIEKVVAEKSHVPQGSLNALDSDKLLNLEAELSSQVVGQKAAVLAVANAIRRSRSGLATDSRPIGSFLFVGPTGVGKTELAKSLARIYFGDEKFFLRLDMSEYQGSGGLEKLLGSSGQSTQTVFIKHLKDYPFCLLLLDEFEKASREVWNIFLQVLDDGRLTTTAGETLSLKNTIIIATSNAGTANIGQDLQQGMSFEQIKSQMLNEILLKTFAPELLNRFDDIIIFTPLAPGEIQQIVRMFLAALAAKIKSSKDIDFTFSDQAVQLVAERGFDPLLGARPIRRYIQDHVDNLIAQAIIKNNPERGAKLHLDVQNNELVLA